MDLLACYIVLSNSVSVKIEVKIATSLLFFIFNEVAVGLASRESTVLQRIAMIPISDEGFCFVR